jgi:hypothetical protein
LRKSVTLIVCVLVVVVLVPSALWAQTAPAADKSRSRGFFVGGLYEGTGAVFGDDSDADSGVGAGLLLGYGFSRSAALYFQLSGASMEDQTGTIDNYGLGHFDIGARFHFLAPRKRVVPYVNVGLSSRAIQSDVGTARVKANGLGVAFGGGVDIHFTPAVAFVGGVTWSAGTLGNITVNGSSAGLDSDRLTTARIELGVVWFVRREQ